MSKELIRLRDLTMEFDGGTTTKVVDHVSQHCLLIVSEFNGDIQPSYTTKTCVNVGVEDLVRLILRHELLGSILFRSESVTDGQLAGGTNVSVGSVAFVTSDEIECNIMCDIKIL